MGTVTITNHPLIQHKLSILRDKSTGTNEFRFSAGFHPYLRVAERDAVRVEVWSRLFDRLEAACDACDAVGDTMADIVLKNV